MGIPIISGFDLTSNSPLDSRTVATNSTARTSIVYKYPGLKVYQQDVNTTYTWNGSAWNVDANNGIYGGSGSLSGDTNVNFGSVGSVTGNSASSFRYIASSTGDTVYHTTQFLRYTGGSGWATVAVRQQVSHNSSTSNISFITHNPQDPRGSGYEGGLEFGSNGSKRLTLTSDGLIRMWSPTYSADFVTSGLTGSVSYVLPSKSGTVALLSDIPSNALTFQNVTDNGPTSSNQIYLIASTGSNPSNWNRLYIEQTATYSADFSTGGFHVYSPILTNNMSNINNIIQHYDVNYNSAAIFVNTYNFGGGSNLNCNQPTVGKNAISALNVYQQSAGGVVAGAVSHMAGIKIDGYKPTFADINMIDYYGLLINPSYTVSGYALDPYYQIGYGVIGISNKYGVYQAGPYDRNYFAGNVGISTLPSSSYNLLVGGTSSFTRIVTTSQTWTNISSFGSGWSATSETPRYTKDAMGNVWLQGVLNGISVTWGSTIFTLPIGYRPNVGSGKLRFTCYFVAGGVYYTAYVHVQNNGDVYIPTTSAPPSTTGQLALNTIMFTTF